MEAVTIMESEKFHHLAYVKSYLVLGIIVIIISLTERYVDVWSWRPTNNLDGLEPWTYDINELIDKSSPFYL